jgi:hypothetical protein
VLAGKKAMLQFRQNNLKSIRDQFLALVTQEYPALDRQRLSDLTSENLFSPFTVSLPEIVLQQATDFISKAYALRSTESYLQQHEAKMKTLGLKDPGNKAICMSYDFHWDGSSLKLIEVNTNAAFLLMSHWLYRAHGIQSELQENIIPALKSSVLEEMKLFGRESKSPRIAIIDEAPQEQRLFIEFILFEEMFKSFSWPCETIDAKDLMPENFDFIYNRTTDFYLTSGHLKNLRKAYFEKQACFSPNPFEYYLLADKQRMIEWSQSQLLPCLGENRTMSPENSEEIWTHRKKYFFKPMRSFGSKQSYRGGTVSRKMFDEIIHQGFIAQEFIPAPEMEFEAPEGKLSLKYDLRFYAYQDQLQGVIARLYQGQTTNLRTTHGGFAPVIFKS